MAGNDGHCIGGKNIAESIVHKEKKDMGPFVFFYKTKERDRDRSKGKEKYCLSMAGTGTAQR